MKYVIIGGVAAGASAAARLRRLDEKAEITLVEKGGAISYANCGLPYHVGGVIKDRARLTVMSKAKFDKLLLATGATPVGDAYADDRYPHVAHLWTLSDMDRVIEKLGAVKRVLVIGAGFIGLEVAENLRHRGIAVTIVQRGEHVLPTMDKEMSQPLAAELRGLGVDIRFGRTVVRFVEGGPGSVPTVADATERVPPVCLINVFHCRSNSFKVSGTQRWYNIRNCILEKSMKRRVVEILKAIRPEFEFAGVANKR